MILGLAPMDGYTDCAYRQIVQEIFDVYGEKSKHKLYLRTEFMSANGYIANSKGVGQHMMTTEDQKNLILQIHGGEEDILVKTITTIQKKYAKYFIGIELNTGCPANNIMKSGGGSELLKDKERTLDIIKSLASASTLPFSIKTRTGLNDDDKAKQKAFILQASKYCAMISIHGRTVKQVYSGDADWKFMYDITKGVERWKGGKVGKYKILGNGGIKSYSEAITMQNNLDGILIGQAAIGNPWIFTPHAPTIEEKKETIIRHLNLTIACNLYYRQLKSFAMPTMKKLDVIMKKLPTMKHSMDIEKTIIAFRKHLFAYVKGIPAGRERKMKISEIKHYKPLVEEIQKFLV